MSALPCFGASVSSLPSFDASVSALQEAPARPPLVDSISLIQVKKRPQSLPNFQRLRDCPRCLATKQMFPLSLNTSHFLVIRKEIHKGLIVGCMARSGGCLTCFKGDNLKPPHKGSPSFLQFVIVPEGIKASKNSLAIIIGD